MKILYLSPNFDNYTASNYQANSIKYIQKFSNLILWGPGYENFDHKLSFENILNKFEIENSDTICVGHGWLSDIRLENQEQKKEKKRYSWIKNSYNLDFSHLEYIAKYDFKKFKGKKIIILNKEYVSIKSKLEFIKKNKFDLALSLNPNYKKYEKITNIPFKFWPNAVDSEIFSLGKKFEIRFYDIAFSGLIQNFNFDNVEQDSLRVKILKNFYLTTGRIKLIKRPRYKNLKIFWNSYTGLKYTDYILKYFNFYSHLNLSSYSNLLKNSKATINTLGPSELIGPRYFETMISGSVCLCEKSEKYEELFDQKKHCVFFEKDLKDFNEKVSFATSDSIELKKIINSAYAHVMYNHTYEKRAKDLIKWIFEIKK